MYKTTVRGVTQDAYAFILGDRAFCCPQKFIDVFNNNGNVITAKYDPVIPWTVHDKNGNFVALFMALTPDEASRYENLPTVQDILSGETPDSVTKEGEIVTETPKNVIETSENDAETEKAAVGSQVPNDNNVIPQPTPETPLNSSSASDDIVSQDSKDVNADENVVRAENLAIEGVNTPNATTNTTSDLNLSEGEILRLKHTKNPYSVFKSADRVAVGPDAIIYAHGAIPYSDEALAEIKKVYGGDIGKVDRKMVDYVPNYKENDVIIQGNPKVVEEKNTQAAYAFIIGDEAYVCQQKFIDTYSGNGNIIKANANPKLCWTVFNADGEVVAVFLPMMPGKAVDYNKYQSVNDVLAEKKKHKEELAKRTFNQTEVRNIVKNKKITKFEMGEKTFISNGKFIISTDESGLELVAEAYGEIDNNNSLPGTLENMLKSDNIYAENVRFDGEALYHEYASGTQKSSVAVVNGEALAFPKKYVDMLKKRSKTMSILNTGTAGAVVLVGYDESGNAIGLTTAIDDKGDYTTKSGDVVPFADVLKLRKTPDIKPEVPKYTPKSKMSIDTKSQSNTSDVFAVSAQTAEHFSNQVNEWQKGTMKKSEMFELGDTPLVLKSLGADDLPVVMTQKVMKKITGGKHNIAIDTIKNLPQAITDPIMVFSSDTVDNAFVILTELTDINGNDVIVAMHLSRGDKHHNINRISSVYGKDNIENFVNAQIKKGNLKYADNKKSLLWSQSRGLQLPKLADTNSGSTDIILQKDNIVNKNSNVGEITRTESFKQWLSLQLVIKQQML